MSHGDHHHLADSVFGDRESSNRDIQIGAVRARSEERRTFDLSLKTVVTFLFLLLLGFGIMHCISAFIQLKEVREDVRALKRQMCMVVPLAHATPNFALESQGARVLHDLSSETYFPQENVKTLWDRICYWLNLSKARRRAIQGHSLLHPGQCWAFSGDRGHLVISLSHPVSITHVTIGHIAKSQSPHGDIRSAPREFSVYGMKNIDEEEIKLGTLVYEQEGTPYQTFELPVSTTNADKGVFRYVKLEIESNWGNTDYTCLYSFRVHGELPT
ncbi:hypothetical protein L3Q82_010608 [Scortum barcoo]|uniref:Uncharacterized protein n=1 Tax=Scortum barcoo TaxID=214431 RepID=A0ACB8WCP7_9TELE|nr:hypothetical protein L3Q82_010608 [Scortum barcoo]